MVRRRLLLEEFSGAHSIFFVARVVVGIGFAHGEARRWHCKRMKGCGKVDEAKTDYISNFCLIRCLNKVPKVCMCSCEASMGIAPCIRQTT